MLSIHNFNWATLGLAKVHFINENYDESKTLLEQLIDHHKSYVEAYDILSDIMRLQGDRLEAQEILVTATKLSPKTILRQKKLGELALQQNDIEIAEKAYKAAITFGQYSYLTSASDHAGYAKVLHARKISTKALEILKEAQKNYREDFDGLLHTEIIEALIYKEQGKHNQSQDIFKTVKSEYLQRHNNLPDILLVDLANTCVKFGEKKMVRKIINKLQSSIEKDQIDSIQHNLASTPDERSENDYLSLNKAGMGLYLKGRIPQAIEMFEQAAESLPNNSSVNMNTAQAIIRYMQNNGTSETKLDDARHYLNRVKLIDEQNPKYLDLEKLLTELIENK
jgi:tetratricopeptide (TPR) repeat protein